jgi:hypothetical protein
MQFGGVSIQTVPTKQPVLYHSVIRKNSFSFVQDVTGFMVGSKIRTKAES